MSDPGAAQATLIRRYARAMRELQSDAAAARDPRLTRPARGATRRPGIAAPPGPPGAARRPPAPA